MQYSVYVNQFFIASHPSCGDLDFTDLAIFDCVRKLIAGNWAKKKVEQNVVWANVSISKILEEMPMLKTARNKPMTKRTIHRRLAKLQESGLLQRDEDNSKKGVAYMALGHLAIDYDSWKEPVTKMSHPSDKNVTPPVTKMSHNKNTIQTIISNSYPLTPVDGGSTEPPLVGEVSTRRKREVKVYRSRITFEDAVRFYDDQLDSLKEKLGGESSSPAAARAAGYKRMVEWMKQGDVELPDGMRDTVMRMGNQLSFDQLCLLMDELDMSWYQLKHYLVRMHSYTENKNLSVYLTIRKWFNDDIAANRVPPKQPRTNSQHPSISQPKQVTQ